MNIARLNKRVTFQKNETVTDAIGNHRSVWSDYYSCMATISGEGGNEKQQAGVLSEQVDLSVTVRSCLRTEAVTSTGYRICFGGELFNIVSIDHFSYTRKALKFKCQKVRDEGE